jgi:hypothetical protein
MSRRAGALGHQCLIVVALFVAVFIHMQCACCFTFQVNFILCL